MGLNWLSKVSLPTEGAANRTSKVFRSAGAILLMILMFLVVTDVIMRNILNAPIVASFALGEVLLGMIVACGVAYCAVQKGHVAIDIVMVRLPQKTRAVIGSITGFLGLALFLLIGWGVFSYGNTLRLSGTLLAPLDIPRFPFALVIGLGFILLCWVLLAQFLKSLLALFGGKR